MEIDMTTRRAFLAGLTAAGVFPRVGWAEAGAPDFLSAARFPDGSYRLAGLQAGGEIAFTLPLPGRGHAGAAHPERAEAVAFARRPGNFAIVLDCAKGRSIAELQAPEGRHFYGHGTFSADGSRLFTAENDYEAGEGAIGIWDAANGYARLGSFASGGVGPHDVALMPDKRTLVVANGGIETHPDTGRAKLNIPTMRPNLTYIGLNGDILESVELQPDLHKNSIRHLALRDDGLVGFAMQWQGDTGAHPPLFGLHERGASPRLLAAPEPEHRQMKGYAGSVAVSRNGDKAAISSPRGGRVHVFDLGTARFERSISAEDVCGLAALDDGFFFTSGNGAVGVGACASAAAQCVKTDCQWDNHLVPVGV